MNSFSYARKWNITLNLVVTLAALGGLLAMVNYLSARHFKRVTWSATTQVQLSPLTLRVLDSVTNRVRVTIYFDPQEPLYHSVKDLLREYQFANSLVDVDTVDYEREPGAAQRVKASFNLNQVADKDLVIFECNGRTKVVNQREMSELDIGPLVSGQSREVKRTHFKGEMLFTSAIWQVTSLGPLKAYFLKDHKEHQPESADADTGYSKFAAMLEYNNIQWSTLSLAGTNRIPADANLLIIAGPQNPYHADELSEIDGYLSGGGRLLVMLNFYGLNRNAGLGYVLSKWGVTVGDDVVRDKSNTSNGQDVFVGNYGTHPVAKPLVTTPMHLVYPRSVRRAGGLGAGVDSPTVEELLYTGPDGTVYTEVRDGVIQETSASGVKTNVCLAVAVEKGRIRDVAADRGTTRLVVVGESFFLNNRMLDNFGNRDFGSLAVNWLLDRSELMGGLGPRPIREYKVVLTTTQMAAMRWVLLAVMPGGVMLLGFGVWARRRR